MRHMSTPEMLPVIPPQAAPAACRASQPPTNRSPAANARKGITTRPRGAAGPRQRQRLPCFPPPHRCCMRRQAQDSTSSKQDLGREACEACMQTDMTCLTQDRAPRMLALTHTHTHQLWTKASTMRNSCAFHTEQIASQARCETSQALSMKLSTNDIKEAGGGAGPSKVILWPSPSQVA